MKKQEDQAKQIEELQKQGEEWKGKYLRALADYQNLEKRVAEQRLELSNFGKEELIGKLLSVIDSLFHAIEGAQKAGERSQWLEGARLSALEFKKILTQEGLEVIPTYPNDDFDLSIHDAIGVKEGPENKIMEIAEMGYKLNGKILRHAKVLVGQRKFYVTNTPNEAGEN